MKRIIPGLFLFLILVTLAFGGLANSTPVEVYVTVTYGQTEARNMLSMINDFRTGNDAWYWNSDNTTKTVFTNLQPLVYDYDLEKTAMQRAAEIAINFDHTRPNKTMCYTAFPSSYGSAGENIAGGQGTAYAAYMAWREDNYMYSGQGHRRNMLKSGFNCIGIGHVKYNGVDFWVHSLAYRSSPNTTRTAAVDSKRTVKIEVSPELVTDVFAVDTEVEVFGETTVSIVYFAMEDGWWEVEYLPVNDQDKPAWQNSTPNLVSLEGNTVKALNAGSATLSAEMLGKAFEWKVSVTPKSISSATVTTDAGGLTYTGKAQTPTVSVQDGTRILVQGKDFTVSYSNNINASTAATATITGKGNYTGSKSRNFMIGKAPLTVTAKDRVISYGDAPTGNGVTYSGFVNGENEKNLGGTLAYHFSYSQYDNIGSNYTVTPYGLQSNNYAFTYANGKMTVVRKALGLNWGGTTLPYQGVSQAPDVTLNGVVNNDAVSPVVTGEQTIPGSYTATVTGLTGAKAGNYKLPDNTSIDFIINNADISRATVTLEDTLTANGQERTQKIKSAILYGMDILAECAISGDTYTTPGTYTLTLTAKSGYYTGSVKKVYVVGAPLAGDVNEDNIVDGRDTVRLMKYLAEEIDPETGKIYYINRLAADVNGDSQVSELDLLRLTRYLAGEIASLQ